MSSHISSIPTDRKTNKKGRVLNQLSMQLPLV